MQSHFSTRWTAIDTSMPVELLSVAIENEVLFMALATNGAKSFDRVLDSALFSTIYAIGM